VNNTGDETALLGTGRVVLPCQKQQVARSWSWSLGGWAGDAGSPVDDPGVTLRQSACSPRRPAKSPLPVPEP